MTLHRQHLIHLHRQIRRKMSLIIALKGVCTLLVAAPFALSQEASYTCADRHPNGVEVWGCFEGEPYWHIAVFAGDRPLVSGGTLYMPSQQQKDPGMVGRVITNATDSFSWQFEAEVNRKVEGEIRRALDKVF